MMMIYLISEGTRGQTRRIVVALKKDVEIVIPFMMNGQSCIQGGREGKEDSICQEQASLLN